MIFYYQLFFYKLLGEFVLQKLCLQTNGTYIGPIRTFPFSHYVNKVNRQLNLKDQFYTTHFFISNEYSVTKVILNSEIYLHYNTDIHCLSRGPRSYIKERNSNIEQYFMQCSSSTM